MRKHIYNVLISTILCVAFLIAGLCCAKNVRASDAKVTYTEYNDTYKESKEIPASSDTKKTLFAGWYKDEKFSTPVKESETLEDSTTKYVYPKFVDPNVMTVKVQITANLNPATATTTDIRLITGVDSANYQNVKFEVTANKKVTYTCKKEAYTSITGTVYGSSTEYDPANTFGTNDANYFITHLLSGAELTMNTTDTAGFAYNNDNFGTTITVIPSWETLDGTVVTGTARQFEINDGLYPVEIDALTGEGETDHVWYSALGVAVTAANKSTKEGAVNIGLLKDLSLKTRITTTRDISIQNHTTEDVTISRSTDFTDYTMIDHQPSTAATLTIGTNEDGAAKIIIDASSANGATENTKATIRNGSTTITNSTMNLYRNVTVQNAKSTITLAEGESTHGAGGFNNNGTAYVSADFIGCTGYLGGAIYSSNGTLAFDGTIQDCQSYRGGGVWVSGGTLDISSGTISNCTASHRGGGIFVDNCILTMTSGTISSCHATTAEGGGVYGSGSAKIYFNSGNITSCSAVHGGGIKINQGTIAGTISGCTATSQGGGVQVSGTLVSMTDGKIQNCTAKNGGAVYVAAAFTMDDGTIQNCTSNQMGGAVYVATNVTFTMNNGIIDGNESKYYGAIRLESGADFTMNGGKLVNNKATLDSTTAGKAWGGAIHAAGNNQIQLLNGEISGNTSTNKSNGIDNAIQASGCADTTQITIDSDFDMGANSIRFSGVTNRRPVLEITGERMIKHSTEKPLYIAMSSGLQGIVQIGCDNNAAATAIYTVLKSADNLATFSVSDNMINTSNVTISCMSYNVLGFNTSTYEADGWLSSEVRAGYIKTYLNESGIDLIGLQEAGSHDYDWQNVFTASIEADGIYDAVPIGEETNYKNQSDYPTKVQNSAGLIILYRKDRFTLLEHGSQRYTSTEKQERHYQWAKLQDKKTGETVFMTNTHWSIDWDENGNASEEAGDEHRTKQANELLAFWQNTVGDSLLFATGDYNCNQNSTWLQSVGSDIYKTADTVLGSAISLRIDHVFVNSECVKVLNYYSETPIIELNSTPYKYSDHNPMMVEVAYK